MIPRYTPKLPKGSLALFFQLLSKNELIKGDYIEKFENEFARYIGVKHAISFSSARNGLILLLQQFGIGEGDEVILPSFTAPAVPSAIENVGAIPIFIDVECDTFNIDVTLIESKITKVTKAIIPTHIDGQPCNLAGVMKLASAYNLKVIEDCAHAIGGEYRGVKVGKFGDAAYFSFATGKQINTLGGGMIVTNMDWLATNLKENMKDASLSLKLPLIKKFILMNFINLCLKQVFFNLFVFPLIRLLNLFGADPVNLVFEDEGFIKTNVKYTNFQAVLGLGQLKLLDRCNSKRKGNAKILSQLLSKKIKKQKGIDRAKSVFLYYDIIVDKRKEIKKKLLSFGIDTQESWNVSCSRLNHFKLYNSKCPVSDELEKKSLYLPVHPSLQEKDIVYIADRLNKVVESVNNE